ncbi:hypothetical protein YC2023_004976 [Brassica napus]|uniref:Uncharacterized protein n=1 Tax=Brassica napus TaxID=3708 RepID=A0A068F4Z4_BRANA|nr:hypothetical protein GSBNAPT00096228020_7N2 [Brassica napus]
MPRRIQAGKSSFVVPTRVPSIKVSRFIYSRGLISLSYAARSGASELKFEMKKKFKRLQSTSTYKHSEYTQISSLSVNRANQYRRVTIDFVQLTEQPTEQAARALEQAVESDGASG